MTLHRAQILGFLPPATHAVAERWLGAASGITASLEVRSDVRHRRLRASARARRHIEIAFDGAVAVLDGTWDAIVEVRGDGGDRTISVLRTIHRFGASSKRCATPTGGPAPRSSARDGVEAVRRICELRRMAGLHD